jgi:hypothetical protein
MTVELFGEIYLRFISVIPWIRRFQHSSKSITTQTIAGNLLQKTVIDVTIRRLEKLESYHVVSRAALYAVYLPLSNQMYYGNTLILKYPRLKQWYQFEFQYHS